MSASSSPSRIAGQIFLLTVLCAVVFTAVGVLYQRQCGQNRRLADALDNMSQGLVMFAGHDRIAVVNRQYIDMHGLSPQIVRAGCTLRRLIQHRKDTGLFAGDIDAYCKDIVDGVHSGKNRSFYAEASDGRVVLARNDLSPGGGWVSTHKGVTEQRRAEEKRAAVRDQEQRRSKIEAAIA